MREKGFMRRLFDLTIPRTWVRGMLLALGIALAAALAVSLVALHYLGRDLPSVTALHAIDPSVKTVILAADGTTLHEFYTENRTLVPLDRIPVRLQEAVIAVEDRRFR